MTSEAPSQIPDRIWHSLLRLLYNKVIKRLRHEPNQIDIIWLGELVKRLAKVRIGFGVSYLDCSAIK